MPDSVYTFQQMEDRIAGVYGGVHVHDAGAGSQSIPAGSTYTKVTCFTDNDTSNGMTPDAANDQITFDKVGVYEITLAASFTGTGTNIEWFGAIFADGVEQENLHFQQRIGVAGDYGTAPINGILEVTSAPVVIDFRVRHSDGTAKSFTTTYANLEAEMIGY